MDSDFLYTFALVWASLIFLSYLYLKNRFKYWTRKGVPSLKPNLIFGNIGDVFLHNMSEVDINYKLYKQLAPYKHGGYFKFQRPVWLVRDPELIKHILTKDFSYFYDRNTDFVNEQDILSYNLFNLTGDKWRHLRAKLSPTFTSGKMKLMFDFMKECAEHMIIVLDRMNESNNDIEMKDFLARYSTDVISSCAFGLQANSLENPDSEFRQMGKKVMDVDLKRWIFMVLSIINPKLPKFFGLSLMDDDTKNFFFGLISNTVKYREENQVVRNDFVNILMGLRNEDQHTENKKTNGIANWTLKHSEQGKEEKLELTMELMAAQSFVFYAAGFETSSGILSHCCLELAKHLDVQEKLRDEINKVLSESNGEITYDCFKKMTYLEQVVCEAMRLYPSLSILFRECTKEYRVPETDVIIEKGTEVAIPVFGIHRDPQYYPNPEEFNPDNFSEENKSARHHYTFLPFGEGPRICIGLRFGMLQMKLALVTLLKKYKIRLSPKTQLPVRFKPRSIVTANANGIWLTCSKIT